jgi:hypothetical protein
MANGWERTRRALAMRLSRLPAFCLVVVGAMSLGASCANREKERQYAISSNAKFVESLSKLPPDPMPEELQRAGFLCERAFVALARQPMIITRLYPGGRVCTYSNDRGASEYRWSDDGKLKKAALETIQQLLASEQFAAACSKNALREKGEYLREVVRCSLGDKRIQLYFYQEGDESYPGVLREIGAALLSRVD